MPLSAGTKFGPYEIVAPLGAGGMGEVYRARDNKLQREVALKVLPDKFARDPERMARFEREAQVLAALNHPNIASIYGVEERALVMELVEGENLQGPLFVNTALDYAKQIAEALEAAHEKGIVHRDLKPANIKITPQGVVKVLDFGLAAVAQSAGSGAGNPVSSPTLTMQATQAGMIMGTAAYMSPEQASAKPVDKRADIWSFGVVLWEMLTGDLLFHGETISHTLADVLRGDIDFNKLPQETPPAIRDLLRRCLDRDVKNRLRDVGEARIVIGEALSGVPQRVEAPGARGPRHLWLWIAATALFALAVPAAWFMKPEAKAEQPLLQVEITAPQGATLGRVTYQQLAFSPDGRRLAFVATSRKDGKRMMWLRPLEANIAVPLPGTENAAGLFWSPDSRWVGFFANGKLQKIDAAGGSPQVICDASGPFGTWSSDGVILFSELAKPIQRVSMSGGTPAPVFELDKALEEASQYAPHFLPDGKHFVYVSYGKEATFMFGSLDGKTHRVLIPASGSELVVTYARNLAGGGWVLYVTGSQLMARPFDPGKGEFTGEAAVIAGSVFPSWSVSANGLLAFRNYSKQTQLTWFSREGKALGTAAGQGNISSYPRISPDQKTIAFSRHSDQPAETDLWLFDITRGATTRFTLGTANDPGYSDYPLWAPDGSRIFYYHYSKTRGGALVERPVNGIGPETTLLKSDADTAYTPTGTSRDGRWLAISEITGSGKHNIILLSRMDGKLVRVRDEQTFEALNASISPDGRWLLYTANTPGHLREVFVQSLPKEAGGSASVEGKWPVSTAGGANPVWRGDGKEIFYLASDGKMMAVPIESDAKFFRPGIPKVLFQTGVQWMVRNDYDVTRDGQRFLLDLPLSNTADEPITVISNWSQLLKK